MAKANEAHLARKKTPKRRKTRAQSIIDILDHMGTVHTTDEVDALVSAIAALGGA